VSHAIERAEHRFTAEQTALIKRTICVGASDDELKLFVVTAQRIGLDPFARQIFAVKRWDSRQRAEVMAIQVSIDGFRLVAERTGCYAPGGPTTFSYDGRGLLESARAHVKKLVGGVWHEISEDAFMEEYVQTNKDGKPNAMWARMPRVMLAKCAESRALRRAFPAELSGIYSPEELDQAASVPSGAVDAEIVAEVVTATAADDELLATIEDVATVEALQAMAPKLARLDGPIKAAARERYKARMAQLREAQP